MVMLANQTGHEVGAMMVMHRGRLGHLYSPGGGRARIFSWQPYALDNGAFGAVENGRPWDVAEWRDMLRWACLSGLPPLWALVPDVPYDKTGTLERWREFAPEVARYGFKLAFAAQNGMTLDDVPGEAHTVFLGGDDAWKDAAIVPWCAALPPGRVHVGRVNGMSRLLAAHHAGAASVDGTRWFTRQNKAGGQWGDLMKYLRETAAGGIAA